MPLNVNSAKKSSAPKKAGPVPLDGVQLGVLVQVVDLGVQPGGEYQGEKKPDCQQIRLTYELPNDVHDFDGEEKPLLISETFNFSSHELSTCIKRINSIDPGLKISGGDFGKLVGTPVMIQITHRAGKGKHDGRVFANVASVSPLMRGMTGPDDTYNPKYSYSPDEHDEEVWEKIPEFLQTIINNRLDKRTSSPAASKPAPKPTPQAVPQEPAESDTGASGDDW